MTQLSIESSAYFTLKDGTLVILFATDFTPLLPTNSQALIQNLITSIQVKVAQIVSQHSDEQISFGLKQAILIPYPVLNGLDSYIQLSSSIFEVLSLDEKYPCDMVILPNIKNGVKEPSEAESIELVRNLLQNCISSGNTGFVSLLQKQKMVNKGLDNSQFDTEQEKDNLIPLLLKLLGLYGDFDEDVVFEIAQEYRSLKQVATCLQQEIEH
ncbi:hypothetical protein WICPIJ_008669 [Wickerhamomyces pijperi]|uniref:Uncharacterized protein n=1 Tax=Wickerhamomyces pijperi TaxID=599730 RepID=A0A9P8THW3_WICPI|nr:hypothetical protein WICPIJ_008669 [Wickerhamomyces pijperi]